MIYIYIFISILWKTKRHLPSCSSLPQSPVTARPGPGWWQVSTWAAGTPTLKPSPLPLSVHNSRRLETEAGPDLNQTLHYRMWVSQVVTCPPCPTSISITRTTYGSMLSPKFPEFPASIKSKERDSCKGQIWLLQETNSTNPKVTTVNS